MARFFLPTTRVLVRDKITAKLDALNALDLWRAPLPLARSHRMALVVIRLDQALRAAICRRQLLLAGAG